MYLTFIVNLLDYNIKFWNCFLITVLKHMADRELSDSFGLYVYMSTQVELSKWDINGLQ